MKAIATCKIVGVASGLVNTTAFCICTSANKTYIYYVCLHLAIFVIMFINITFGVVVSFAGL